MRVLITTDGSEFSYEAAKDFIKLTHGTRHEIRVLYVIPRIAVGRDIGYLEMEEEREGSAALNTVKGIFRDIAVPVETELRQGDPTATILQIAREGDYSLIVMGRRGRGGFREIFLGSVTKVILRKAPCAVLIGR